MRPANLSNIVGARPRNLGRVLLLAALMGCSADTASNSPSVTGGSAMRLEITSSAFQEGGIIPKDYTGFGSDVSPPLKWSAPPEGTMSLALICDDPDAPKGTWAHWVVFNLPADLR